MSVSVEKNVTCSTCGDPFETEADRARRNDNHYCSRECWRESLYNRVEVQCEVCGTTEEVTETRAKDYRTCSKECMGKLQTQRQAGEANPNRADVDTTTLVKEYEDGASTVDLARRYGMTDVGVARRLREADVDLDEPGYPREVETERGELVRSSYEKRVADWMFSHGLDYEYEPDIDGPYVPDFRVNGTLVEVWGVENEEYAEHRIEKESWYDQHGEVVIGIEPDDLDTLNEPLGGL